jgi:EmrB/QacA subfamily drug resistance transporter
MKSKWWILVAMSSGMSIIFLDQTILPVALPTIAQQFSISELGMQWLINAYLLTLTSLVLAGGRIGDIFGHRKIFSLGMFLFMLASISCSLSQSIPWFIFSRAIQGCAGALIIPTAAPILLNSFPAEQKGKIFGIYISIGALFLSVGPIAGGLITQYLDWRYIFWINVPIVSFGLILTSLFVPKSEKREESFDFLGFFTTAFGISLLITGLMQGKEWGWTYWPVPSMFITGILLLLALALFDREVKDPFIDFNLFRNKDFLCTTVCIFTTQSIIALTIFWAIYFQTVLHYSPSFAGLWAMLANIPVILFSNISGYLFDRFGPKLPIILGYLSTIAGILWFVVVPTPSTPIYLFPIVFLFGCGIPMILLPCTTFSMSIVPPHKKGVVMGMNMTIRQFGATLGLAIFGQVLMTFQESFFAKSMAKDPATATLNPKVFEGLLAHSKFAIDALKHLPQEIATKITNDYLSASVASSQIVNLCGAAVAAIGFISAFLLLRWGKYNLSK